MALGAPARAMAATSGFQPIKRKPVAPRYGGSIDTYVAAHHLDPSAAAPAPVAAAAPPPPAPLDFNALTLTDPQYTTGKQQLDQQNQIALESLLRGFKGTSQSYQDNANAHGALFSGAAVNAQRSAAQQYADQQRQQALNQSTGQSNLYQNVFNRLIQQLAGVH